MNNVPIKFDAVTLIFKGKLFCFTGIFVNISRKEVEAEVRKRGGIISKSACDNLNYLIVGSKPSPSWKYGSYGNKIEETCRAIKKGFFIKVISEELFIHAIEEEPVDKSNVTIKEKILVINFELILNQKESGYKKKSDIFKHCIAELRTIKELYIQYWANPIYEICQYTIENNLNQIADENIEIHKYRFMKLFKENDTSGSTALINIINDKLKATGVEGTFKYYERHEGSSFHRLKAIIPAKFKKNLA